MKTRKILLVSLMALLCVSLAMFIVACSKQTSGYKFEKYEYNNGTSEDGNWTDLEYPDTDMNVDGSVTTEEYGESFLSFTDVNGVNMKVYAHMGEEGVFFGFVSDDKSVYYHEEASVYDNTSVEIQVAPANTATLNSNVIQLRLGANGYAEQWIGFKAQDKQYDYTRKHVPSMGAVLINGELNTSTCNGYSMELYLPYSSLNLSEKPESIVCAPSFNTKRSYTSGPRATWTMMLGCNLSEPATWYVVNDTGMTTYTSGFIANEDGTEYAQVGTGNEFYFFDYESYDAFNLETTITSVEFLNSEIDKFPKFGLVSKSENGLIAYYIDAAQLTGTNFGKVEAVQSTNAGTTWGWDYAASTSLPDHWASEYIGKYESIKMNLIYLDGNLYMLMNGKLVNSERGNAAMQDGAIPGFMTFNTSAEFTNTSLVTDETAIRELMADILPQEVDIDGDLSDWDALTTVTENALHDQDETFTRNEWTVRAFLGSDGLYIAYDVNHLVQPKQLKWDDGWFKNTNVELYVGGGASTNQFALTSFGSGGYMDAVMTTTEMEDVQGKYYHTIAEIFIPMYNLEAYTGEDEITSVEVGFAFKTDDNEKIDLDNGETMYSNNWWYFMKEPNVYYYTVTSNGIQPKDNRPAPTEKTLDGDLSDWENIHSLSIVGTEDFEGKSATFYAQMTDEGLYLAADVYYGLHNAGMNQWYTDTNFEFFVGSEKVQHYIYATGANQFAVSAQYMYQETVTTEADGIYHTVAEVFIPSMYVTGVQDGVARVGVAWKTPGDQINNGADGNGTSEYWLVQGTHQNNDHMCYVDSTGIYRWMDYGKTVNADITLDGDVADWAGVSTMSIVGSGEAEGKRATFYGVMTDAGLYLAVDAHYAIHMTGQAGWFNNTNFEFFMGMGDSQKQFYVYATGADSFAASETYMQISSKTKGTEGAYHTVIEVFIPKENLIGEQDGTVRVGVAWKTNGDTCNNGAANSGGMDSYWVPKGTFPNNDDKGVVTTTGIYSK